jgi:hypothetical protein
LRYLLQRLNLQISVGLISKTPRSKHGLLCGVMMSLNQASEEPSSCSALFNRFQCFLYAEYHKGHHVILIVDEAQNVRGA